MGLLVRRLVAVVAIFILAILLAWSMLWNYMQTPVAGLTESSEIEVVRGASLQEVAETLAAKNILKWPSLFVWWGRLNGSAERIQAGVYTPGADMTLAELLALMERGKVTLYPVTILEGWTITDLLAALAKNPILVTTLDPVSSDFTDILGDSVIASSHAEGRFFPETYMVPRKTLDTALLRQASRLMEEKLEVIWNTRDQNLPITSPYELLILASIIERETALESERAKIAGVFVRRLQSGMRLQTDPTVIYGIGADFDGNLTRKHLETDTPYNTYTRFGLPPTPIGLPGEASLYAAAHPAEGDEVFFVASGKGDGSHVFSKTLREHNAAVARMLALQRETRTKSKVDGDDAGGTNK